MKSIAVLFLAFCAYGQAASLGPRIAENGKEVVYTTADQVIHRLAYIDTVAEGISPSGVTWFDAQLECISRGYKGLLAAKSLEAQSALEFAIVAFNMEGCPWIGLHRTVSSQTYKWSDGTLLGDFINWRDAEGSLIGGVCVRVDASANQGKWEPAIDGINAKLLRFICES